MMSKLPKIHKDDIITEHPVMGTVRFTSRNIFNDAGELYCNVRLDAYKQSANEFVVLSGMADKEDYQDFIDQGIPLLLAEWNKPSSPDPA